jgi:hypothetical protein
MLHKEMLHTFLSSVKLSSEELRGLEDFKEWIAGDRKALPDMEVTAVDNIEEQNKLH